MEAKPKLKPGRKPGVVYPRKPVVSPIDEICNLLEKCAMLGVSELTTGELTVKFSTNQSNTVADTPDLSPPVIVDSTKAPIYPDTPHVREGSPDQIQMVDPQLLDDMRKSQLLIDDPVGFENEMIDAHLREYFHNEVAQDR